MSSREYQVIILDEADTATHYDLFSVHELLEFIQTKPKEVEPVITRRMADPRIIEGVDPIMEMKEDKHYFQRGVRARDGNER